MTPREMVIAQILHQETPSIPFTFNAEAPVGELLDAHFGSASWRASLPAFIVRNSCVDPDCSRPLGPGREQDAFGTVWRTDLRPKHHERPGLAQPDFAGYAFPPAERFLSAERTARLQAWAQAQPDSFKAAGFGWGLFERSWTIRGFENALMDSIAEEDFYAELLDRITELHLELIRESLKAPVDAIMFSDDWGDQRGVILGPERWRRFMKPRLARLYAEVHAAGRYTLSHCCGNVAEIVPDLIEIGLDVLESVQPEAMDPYALKRRYGDRITFWGGLGSQRIIPFGTPAEIRAETARLCGEMSRGGGYILSTAKALQPETPLANALAVLESFQEFSRAACPAAGR